MRRIALLAAGALLLGLMAPEQANAQTAKAELRNAQGEKVGSANLSQTPQGVRIAVEVSKLPPGTHGLHIHAVGKCEAPGFTTAGGHFNPNGKKHGLKSAEGPHAGDLPNLSVTADGSAKAEVVARHASLGSSKDSLFQPGGTALVVHADADDERTDPTGNAGSRIACGVITR